MDLNNRAQNKISNIIQLYIIYKKTYSIVYNLLTSITKMFLIIVIKDIKLSLIAINFNLLTILYNYNYLEL